MVSTSVWPDTATSCWRYTFSVVILWDGLHLAGLHRGHGVGRPPSLEGPTPRRRRQHLQPCLHGQERRPVPRRPLPFPPLEHRHRTGGAEAVVVQRCLDLEDTGTGVPHHGALTPVGVVQFGVALVHERPGLQHRGHVVVVAQPLVAGQPGDGALPATVHGHEVDVHVDDQVALGGAAADLHLLAVVGDADDDHAVGILCVVVVEPARRGEGVVHPVADGVAQFGSGHAAVQRQRGDDVYVIGARSGGHVQDGLDHLLADVGSLHRGQREGDVVEGDGEPHARSQQGGERFAVDGMFEGVADGADGIGQPVHGAGRIDDPGAPCR